jgi:glycosyltransferase involved in cell wall biosynthesis/SAM-dependent methyltransferase
MTASPPGPQARPDVPLDELVRTLLGTCGGGPVLVLGERPAPAVRALRRRGVAAEGLAAPSTEALGEARPADTVLALDLLDRCGAAELDATLAHVRRAARRYLLATVLAGPGGEGVAERGPWERRLIAAGFRVHPLTLDLVPYAQREHEAGRLALLLERVPDRALERFPLARLEEERMLHMDMLRDTGRRAEAHVARYDLARRLVRPGDVVLDVACGLGYGSAVVAVGSPAARVVGVDESAFAVEYARASYGLGDGLVEFRQGDACALDFVPDASVDLVVSFETLEHVHEPERLLAELQRVLRPAGRLLASVPNDWTDESGEDPNPHHHHVYDWEELRRQVAARFRPERAWAQSAGGALKLSDAARELVEVALDPPPARPAEWWLVCAMKDPVGADPSGYRETSFPAPGPPDDVHVTAFGRDYDDPWLVKGMVSIGMRTENDDDRRAMALEVLERARTGSADEGAALCLLAYDRLADPGAPGPGVARLLDRIARYHEDADGSPHAWRWRVSNAYAAALLLRAEGRRAEAIDAFVACGRMDALRFSPILATKTVDALFQAGLMCAAVGRTTEARELWRESLAVARRAAGADWRGVLGDLERPIPFGLPEASQMLDLAGRAAYALEALEHWDDRPGWSWTRALTSRQREQERLLEVIGELNRYARSRVELADSMSRELADLRQRAAESEAERRRTAVELAELAGLREALERIHDSDGWALLQRYYRLRERLLPRGSWRYELTRRVLGRGPTSAAPPAGLRAWVPAPLKQRLKAARSRWHAARTHRRDLAAAREAADRLPALPDDPRPLVLLQVSSFDKGGLEEVVLTLARHLARSSELRVAVLTLESDAGHNGRIAELAGIPVLTLGGNVHLLRELIHRLRPALVNLHYSTFGHEEYRRAGVPLVYTVHNTYVWAGPDFVAERAPAYAAAERFLAVSSAVKEFFVHRFPVDPALVEVVPNGLDLEYVAAAAPFERLELGLSEEDIVFLNVASFNVNKFHPLMLAAMERVVRELPRARLLLVGNVHEQRCHDYALAEIERRGLDQHVRVLDFLPKERVMGLMAISDCFLLPSLIEGWSIAVMEAMYSGLPLILSDVGSARDVIEDGDIGIVVPPPYEDIRELTTEDIHRRYADDSHLANLDALVEAMLTIGRDRAAWAERGRLGRVKIETRFDAATMGRAYERCFLELLGRPAEVVR